MPSPHVFAISLTSRAAWKSQQTLSPPSLSHTYSTCTPVADLQCIKIVVVLVFFTVTPYALTYVIPFTLFLSRFCLDYISSHTNVLSVCLSVCPSLLTLGTGANTLNCLQSWAQLQLAKVLHGTELDWVHPIVLIHRHRLKSNNNLPHCQSKLLVSIYLCYDLIIYDWLYERSISAVLSLCKILSTTLVLMWPHTLKWSRYSILSNTPNLHVNTFLWESCHTNHTGTSQSHSL